MLGAIFADLAAARADPNTLIEQPAYGVNAWEEPLSSADLGSAHSAGFGYYRVAFDRRSVTVSGDPPVEDYTQINAIVTAAANAHVALLPILRKTDANGQYDPITTQSERTDFVQFAAQMALRYGPGGSFWLSHPQLPQFPIQVWEVWNEPNSGQFWGGSPNAHDYGLLLEATRRWMRIENPEVRVLSGGLAQQAGDWRAFMDGVMNAAKTQTGNQTGKCAFDGVSIHPYGRIISDDSGASSVEPQGFVSDWRSYLTSRNIPSSVPLWITEVGWSSSGTSPGTFGSGTAGTPSRQDASLRIFLDFVRQNRSTYNLGAMFYFAYRDRSTLEADWHTRTGLIDYTGTRLPAWTSYSNIALAATYLPSFPQRPLTC